MFVVKDPDLFAASVIPQYFDHNKFSSFARQLNFYGFRKMQAKPIRNSDFDEYTAKHVTFFNEKFKRGRCDLLKEIQRSTRGGGLPGSQDHAKEVQELKDIVASLEDKITELNAQMEERMRRLELDMLGRMEQMMLAMQQHQATQALQLQAQISSSNGDTMMRQQSMNGDVWDILPLGNSAGLDRGKSNVSFSMSTTGGEGGKSGPTLPPHPKQKQFPPTINQDVPNALSLPPSRMNSLRGISRGVPRGASEQSSVSAVLLRNSWEDKFFSMLMLGENEQAQQQAQAAIDAVNGGPISDASLDAAIAHDAGPIMNTRSHATDRLSLSRQDSEQSLSSVSDTEPI
jgi:HSF-type DNA-binding